MASGEPQFCKVLKPTKEEWNLPFTEYIEAQLKQHKDFAMLKIIPPRGYIARREGFPKLEQIRIQTPIRQHVFGTQGTYRCLLEEQKALSVADFKRLSYSRAHRTPPKGHRQDDLLERAFWSAVTLNPPLYGADTPVSFFDEKVEGWNIKNLGCLLTQHNVPRIPGVTTPMTYFGMWKSFFSWHVEDMDLFSINYMHFGAPKVWYCVSPKDRAKFEAMARAQFPELYRCCPCFLRHKDILISPRVLRNHHIEYTMAKQEAGEFIVLNAGAYHSGFNMGFNCAEAVNFALQQWLPIGRAAEQCDCSALPDGVCLDMVLFRKSRKLREQSKQGRQVSTRSRGSAASDASSMSEDSDLGDSSGEESGTDEDNSEASRVDIPALQAAARQAEAEAAVIQPDAAASSMPETSNPDPQEASKVREGGRPMLERRHKTAASTALALLSVSTRTREAWQAAPSARLRKRTTRVLRARVKALKRSAGRDKHSRRLAPCNQGTPPPHVKAATGGGPRNMTSHQRSGSTIGILGKRGSAGETSGGYSSDEGAMTDDEGDARRDGIWFPGCTHVSVPKKLREAAKRARTAAGVDLKMSSPSRAPPGMLHVDKPAASLLHRKAAHHNRSSHKPGSQAAVQRHKAGSHGTAGPASEPEGQHEQRLPPLEGANFQDSLKAFFRNLKPRTTTTPHAEPAVGDRETADEAGQEMSAKPAGGLWPGQQSCSPASSGHETPAEGHSSDVEEQPVASSPEEALAWARKNYRGPSHDPSSHPADGAVHDVQPALPADASPAASGNPPAGDAMAVEARPCIGALQLNQLQLASQQAEPPGAPAAESNESPGPASAQHSRPADAKTALYGPLTMSTEFDPVPDDASLQGMDEGGEADCMHGVSEPSRAHPAAAAPRRMRRMPMHPPKRPCLNDAAAFASKGASLGQGAPQSCPPADLPRAASHTTKLEHEDMLPSAQASSLPLARQQTGERLAPAQAVDEDVVVDISEGPTAGTPRDAAASGSDSDVEILAVVDPPAPPSPRPAHAANAATRQAASPAQPAGQGQPSATALTLHLQAQGPRQPGLNGHARTSGGALGTVKHARVGSTPSLRYSAAVAKSGGFGALKRPAQRVTSTPLAQLLQKSNALGSRQPSHVASEPPQQPIKLTLREAINSHLPGPHQQSPATKPTLVRSALTRFPVSHRRKLPFLQLAPSSSLHGGLHASSQSRFGSGVPKIDLLRPTITDGMAASNVGKSQPSEATATGLTGHHQSTGTGKSFGREPLLSRAMAVKMKASQPRVQWQRLAAARQAVPAPTAGKHTADGHQQNAQAQSAVKMPCTPAPTTASSGLEFAAPPSVGVWRRHVQQPVHCRTQQAPSCTPPGTVKTSAGPQATSGLPAKGGVQQPPSHPTVRLGSAAASHCFRGFHRRKLGSAATPSDARPNGKAGL